MKLRIPVGRKHALKIKFKLCCAQPVEEAQPTTLLVPSTSSDRTYHVVCWPDGKTTCTCPDFTYRDHFWACKHIRGLGRAA